MSERPTPETDALLSKPGLPEDAENLLVDLARSLECRLGEAAEQLDAHCALCELGTIAALQAVHDKALARVRELEGALDFYADRETWLPGNEYRTGDVAAFVDCGARARAALQEKPRC
jgi:hypothetical protein